MHISRRTAVFLVACCLVQGAHAETIYRSVDKNGEVTFSDEPPPAGVNVEQIEVQPAPTESEYRESVEQMQRMEPQAGGTGADTIRNRPGEHPGQLPVQRLAAPPAGSGEGGGRY